MADFGPWLPDLPEFNHGGLTVARNVYASPVGYKPIKELAASSAALGTTWKGGASFIADDGTTVNLAGANAGLYEYSSGAWALDLAGSYTENWFFAQFGGLIVGVNGGAPVKYTISTATGANLGGSPPNSTMIAVVRDFVFLAGDSAANTTVTWSASNNAEGWTAGTGQSDIQVLPDGGPITGLAGGEFGLVFQENAIHRFSYVGAPIIFQRDKVSEAVGCITPGAVCQYGRLCFFLSPRGFYAYADGELRAIGQNKIDETFWTQYDRADVISSIRCAIDPTRALVMWSMPDGIWCYNWELDRWTEIAIPGLLGLSNLINSAVSLEDIDTLYPDGGSGNIDAVPISLDDPSLQGGGVSLTVVKSDGISYKFGGQYNLEATLTMARQEIIPGRKARVRKARIVGDVTDGVRLSVGYSQRLGDALATKEAQTIRDSGDMPIRVSGRYLQPSLIHNYGSNWSYCLGMELEAAAGGRR